MPHFVHSMKVENNPINLDLVFSYNKSEIEDTENKVSNGISYCIDFYSGSCDVNGNLVFNRWKFDTEVDRDSDYRSVLSNSQK